MIRGGRGKVRSLLWKRNHSDQETPAPAPEKKKALGRLLWRSFHGNPKDLSLPAVQFLDIQYKEKPMGFRFPRHAHSRFAEFYYVDRGKVGLKVGGRGIFLNARQGILFLPGKSHEVFGDPAVPANVLTLHFQSQGLFRSLPALRALAGKPLTLGEESRSYLRSYLERLNRDRRFFGLRAGIGLLEFLLLLLEGPGQGGEGGAKNRKPFSSFAGKVEKIIRENTGKRLTLTFLAAQLGTSLSSLAHRYREESGETVKQAILRCRVERAKEILRNPETSVKETAYRTGFTSSSALSTAFRKQEGLTPGEYQKSLASSLGPGTPS